MPLREYAEQLERLYRKYNRREYVHPDPLEFLYRYDDPADREAAALIAALFAYGNVKQILKSVSIVLERLGPRVVRSLLGLRREGAARMFDGFRHRFQGEQELVGLLMGIQRTLKRHGTLGACFASILDGRDETILPALCGFVRELDAANGSCGHLIPDPTKGSACKRLHLYLRWMVRKDEVDVGGWDFVSPAKLIVPVDTHMHRIARMLGATARKSADLRTAVEITTAFRTIRADDPVRYDFALTRLGIRDEMDPSDFFIECGKVRAQHS